MSKIVGALLLTATHIAGHREVVGVRTDYDILADEILVRFDTDDKKSVLFRIPNHLFDPVEHAQAKWPEWFVRRPPPGTQLDLFSN
jgi:hypothetical protein